MPVRETCSRNNLAVVVDLGSGRHLRYTIADDGSAEFTLRTDSPATLLTSAAGARECVWPSAAHAPASNPATHTLGIAFGEPGELRFLVELLDAAGSLIAIVKQCTYRFSDGPPQSFHTSLEIHTT